MEHSGKRIGYNKTRKSRGARGKGKNPVGPRLVRKKLLGARRKAGGEKF